MKVLYVTIFFFLFGVSTGWGVTKGNGEEVYLEGNSKVLEFKAENIYPKKEINVQPVNALLDEIKNNMLPESKEEANFQREERVSVIKRSLLKPLLKSLNKKQQAYLSLNRYERVPKVSSGKNQRRRQIKLARDIESTIRVIDKPLVLGGNGFGTTGLNSDMHRLHFTFNSHIKASPDYQISKEDITDFDLKFDKAQSQKFLIFHPSRSSFKRQANLLQKVKLEQYLEKNKVNAEIEAAPSSWIFLDAHVKDFQNKETNIRLLPSRKHLDLIHDNTAILKYDYQVLNSGGS